LDVMPIKLIGFNCCKPEAFDLAMDGLTERTLQILQDKGIQTGCYPNGLGDIPSDNVLERDGQKKTRHDMTSKWLYQYVHGWIDKYHNEKYRLSMIGGCCAVDPCHLEFVVQSVYNDFPHLLMDECTH